MASLCNDKNGKRRIMFKGRDGKRRAIHLGAIQKKTAESVLLKVEKLISARITGNSPDNETSVWLAGISKEFRQKLERADLIDPINKPVEKPKKSALEFIDSYLESKTGIKPQTKFLLEQSRNDFQRFLKSKGIVSIEVIEFTSGHAIDFRNYLIGWGLAENTVRRRCGRLKQCFDNAVAYRLIDRNPFKVKEVPTAVGANEERQEFISRAMIDEVLEACPCPQWRLLVALARFGGLRTPSEPLLLKWGDVDWERRTIRVQSPKTAHHKGKGSRIVPMFPEIVPHLEKVFEVAPEGSEFILSRFNHQAKNLRTQFSRILRNAGIVPWGKLFQNLRSTRETELVNEYPIHIVCKWIGNSQAVAMKHYLQVTDEHLERATKGAQYGAVPDRITSCDVVSTEASA